MLNVKALIAEFGVNISLIQVSANTYDPINDTFMGGEVSLTVKAQIETYKNDMNEIVKAGMYKAFIYPSYQIKENDKIVFNGDTFFVKYCFPYMVGGVVEYYEVAFSK